MLFRSENPDGSAIARYETSKLRMPTSTWNRPSHNAEVNGTELLKALLGGKLFDYPKSLYAVEDALRLFVGDKPDALVVDFFSGSGTTAHATMRLNKQDGGRRRSIMITNNEASAKEEAALRQRGLRPDDAEWKRLGICELITVPRLKAAITGQTPAGRPVTGNYRFIDEFPISTGLEENVEFFELTYEAPLRVSSNREFRRVAPLLWMRAGSRGKRIDDLPKGWAVVDAYGVLANLDCFDQFLAVLAAEPGAEVVFIITEEDRLFESVVRELPEHVEPVRLYDAYLRNFEIESGRAAR